MTTAFRARFARTQLTRKGKALLKTACLSCGAYQLAVEPGSSLPVWEVAHVCNLAFREAIGMFESAVLMRGDITRMQATLEARRKRLRLAA